MTAADRPPCLDDPSACQPGDCWCTRWGAEVPLPEPADDPEPEPAPRPIHDVPTGDLL